MRSRVIRSSWLVVFGSCLLYACSSFSSATDTVDAGLDATTAGDGGETETGVGAVDAGFVARDQFERNETDGFGAADVGGRWFAGQSSLPMSVGMGRGHFAVTQSGQNGRAYLTAVMAQDVEIHVAIHFDKIFATSKTYVSVQARGTANTDRYFAGVVVRSGAGASNLSAGVGRPVGLAASAVNSMSLGGVDLSTVAVVELRAQIYGTYPTNVRMRAWPAGTPEPAGWPLIFSDATKSLQVAGAVGVELYTDPIDAGGGTYDVTLDDFEVTALTAP
jgi:hypothetical protein